MQQSFSAFDGFWRHMLAQICAAFSGTLRAPDCSEIGPKKCANGIGASAVTCFKGARYAQLRRSMAFGRGAHVIFKAANGVLGNAKAKSLDISEQKFGFGVACIGRRYQMRNGRFKLGVGKGITGFLHVRGGGQGEAAQKKKQAHGLGLWLFLALSGPVWGQDLPKPLGDGAFLQVDPEQARLGRLLFYDPILSGNRNISCATCHSPAFGTGDGVSLGFGEGGIGMGPDRRQGTALVRQSRNAPALWNMGARDVRVLFHDGRVERLEDGRFSTPAGRRLPHGLKSVAAAQALFPLIARTEMAGDPNENDVADAAVENAPQAWTLIANRVAEIEEYRELGRGSDVEIHHIVNALADYMNVAFRADDTAFDRYLRGDKAALSDVQHRGMRLFYGAAGCADCHSGTLFSDQSFHGLGLVQFGPGMTTQFDPIARDLGRGGVTSDRSEWYRFRTPFLRNVALSAPYGHTGAYATLEEMVKHHFDPIGARRQWDQSDAQLPRYDGPLDDFAVHNDALEQKRLENALTIAPRPFTESDIRELVAFLKALTDAPNIDIPETVPSGLNLQ